MMAIICFGEHNHPPPPQRRIPPTVKDEIVNIIKFFGTGEATARRIVASPILPIMLNGKTTLSQEHISLTNQGVVNYLIRKERYKEYPHGTDFLGVIHLSEKQHSSNRYIRQTIHNDDGSFVILCQSKQQSELYFHLTEIQADKTFSRTQCREFEINGYCPETSQLTTLSRIFINSESAEAYELAFRLAFATAEVDVGRKIPWGHLLPFSETEYRIKAVLLDEHLSQMQGLGRYLASEYQHKGDADWHIPQIVKICQVHYRRSITRLAKKGVSNGIILKPFKANCLEICARLVELMDFVRAQHFDNALIEIQNIAIELGNKHLTNWLEYKVKNPWIFQCLSRATTMMNATYWMDTSFTTNIAESAHAQSQRDGTKLTLVAAIQRAAQLDSRFFETRAATRNMGVPVRYGDRSVSGLAKRNINRAAKANEKRKDKGKELETANQQTELMMVALTGLTANVGELTKIIKDKLI